MIGRGLRLGRLGGVDIHLDWSLLLIFALVTAALGSALFPQWHPEWSMPMAWAVAAAAAVLFFASVLLHELSHAWVGRAQGIDIHRITLFVFGGMAHMDSEPETWQAEFRMAVVGPITSFAIGFGCLAAGMALAGGMPGDPRDAEAFFANLGPFTTLLFWLGPVNVVLAVFNLVPGFPLDGGRVLRAVLWGLTGDLDNATRWASNGGRAFAWLLIACGVAMLLGFSVPVFGSGAVNGFWLALIGWFLHGAAVGSYRQLVVQQSLADVPSERLMQTHFEVVPPGMPLGEFVDGHLLRSEQRAWPVVDDARFVGLVCLDDIRGLPRDQWRDMPVEKVMTGADSLVTIEPSTGALHAMELLNARGVNQLPVVDRGRIRGLISRGDVLRWLALYGSGSERPIRDAGRN